MGKHPNFLLWWWLNKIGSLQRQSMPREDTINLFLRASRKQETFQGGCDWTWERNSKQNLILNERKCPSIENSGPSSSPPEGNPGRAEHTKRGCDGIVSFCCCASTVPFPHYMLRPVLLYHIFLLLHLILLSYFKAKTYTIS